MAEETEFAMGAKASCVDGPGGKVIRVIIDPATKTVTHLVIEPKHRVGSGCVPLDLVDSAADGIRLPLHRGGVRHARGGRGDGAGR